MGNTIRRRWSAALLLIGGGLALLLVTGLVPSGFLPWQPAAQAQTMEASECKVEYLALDPADQTKVNPDKEVQGAFGPIAASLSDEAVIKEDLKERRTCGTDDKFDTALTASHYAAWSHEGLTKHKVTLDEIDAFAAKINADRTLYGEVLAELESLENGANFSLENGIPAGAMSLYMVPDGKGIALVKSGSALTTGTSAVFTHGDKVVRYRLDCGYQPWWPKAPKELPPPCTGSECVPPPPPVEPPVCTENCEPYIEPKDPSQDPWQQGNAPEGGGVNHDPGPGTYIPPTQMEQPPETPRVNPEPPAPAPPTPNPSNPTPPVPDPTPPPPAEPEAPKPTAPKTGCVPMPGVNC